jgi:hypothetical protein
MSSRCRLYALFAAWSVLGCAPTPHAESPPSAAPAAAAASARSAAAPASASARNAGAVTPVAPVARACGALGCLAFATAGAAFDYVLQSNPRVLAIGEAHAQDSTPGIPSSTRRFAEQLLPKLAGRSKHIVIELLLANCKQQTVAQVKQQQAPVTEHQAKTNQSEFVTLGKVAERLGIEPQGLMPDCPEYEAVVNAGEDGVARLLSLVAAQTAKEVEALLAPPDAPSDLILTYGGALHNDLNPRPGQEAWSFGPRLAAATQNRYLELDLIVPEFVKDTEAWRNLPWYAAFDREHLSNEALLFRPAPNSFVLIFPKTEPGAEQQL